MGRAVVRCAVPSSSPLPPPPLPEPVPERVTRRLSLTGGEGVEIPIGESEAGRGVRIGLQNRRAIATGFAAVWAVLWPIADRDAAGQARYARWGGHAGWLARIVIGACALALVAYLLGWAGGLRHV